VLLFYIAEYAVFQETVHMKEAFVEKKDGLIRIRLSGHIDANNAEEIKSEIFAQIGEDTSSPVLLMRSISNISPARVSGYSFSCARIIRKCT
jgi:hypothetical protein